LNIFVAKNLFEHLFPSNCLKDIKKIVCHRHQCSNLNVINGS
jgi:hypothetical protein